MTNGITGAMLVRRTMGQVAGTMEPFGAESDGQGSKKVLLRELLSDPHDGVLRAAVVTAISQAIGAGERDFVLDLTGVIGLDRTGLALLVDLLRRVCCEGGTVRISGANAAVRRTLTVSCLSSLFG